MTAINEDRELLGLFLRELVEVQPPIAPHHRLSVLEQQYPGEDEPDEDDLERRGIPDGWIYNDDGWCVFIEVKVFAKLSSNQISAHRRTAERRDFQNITAVAIAPSFPSSLPDDTKPIKWKDVYAWLRRHSAHPWAARTAEYLEIIEAKMIDKNKFMQGTLTKFAGFRFKDEPFTYLKGKHALRLAITELKNSRDLIEQLGMNPNVKARGAITGRHSDSVWDVLSLSNSTDSDNFTNYPHLTLNVRSTGVEAMVTVPHKVNASVWRKLDDLHEAGFSDLVTVILDRMKPFLRKHNGAAPWCRGIQRRYPSRKAIPYVDAKIEFDLRTAISSGGAPKMQPTWLSAAYASFVQKRGSNYQIQIGVKFDYRLCPELQETDAINMIVEAWLSCKPLLDLVR
jgi:hypothetical protein